MRYPPYVPPRCPICIPSRPLAHTTVSASDHGYLSLHVPVPPTRVPVPGLAQGTPSAHLCRMTVTGWGMFGNWDGSVPATRPFLLGHTALTHRLLTPNTCCQRLSRIYSSAQEKSSTEIIPKQGRREATFSCSLLHAQSTEHCST